MSTPTNTQRIIRKYRKQDLFLHQKIVRLQELILQYQEDAKQTFKLDETDLPTPSGLASLAESLRLQTLLHPIYEEIHANEQALSKYFRPPLRTIKKCP